MKVKSTTQVTEAPVEEVTATETVKAAPKKAAKVTAVVTAKLLNIRAKADANADILEKVVEGTVLKVLDTNPDWTEVETPSGVKGSAMTQFLSIK